MAAGVQNLIGARVAIVVEPRLLAETLHRALRRPELDVVIYLDHVGPDDAFDAAVVLGSAPEGMRADVVVTLPDGLGEGSITTADGTQTVLLGDLAAVVETLHTLLGLR